jgi:hypothetical protein
MYVYKEPDQTFQGPNGEENKILEILFKSGLGSMLFK